jgi:hypothetical protein
MTTLLNALDERDKAIGLESILVLTARAWP